MSCYLKDPRARVDYAIDWGAKALGTDSIAASSWSVSPDHGDGGLAVTAFAHDDRIAAVTVEGGRIGATYDMTNRIETTGGRIDTRSICFRVELR